MVAQMDVWWSFDGPAAVACLKAVTARHRLLYFASGCAFRVPFLAACGLEMRPIAHEQVKATFARDEAIARSDGDSGDWTIADLWVCH